LTSETIDGDAWTSTYDAAGNRLTRLPAGSTYGTTSTYGVDNRLLAQTTIDASGARSASFAYDGRGRRTNDLDGNVFVHGPQGRVERIEDGTGSPTATFAYGVDGLRVSGSSSAGATEYLWGPGSFTPYVVEEGTHVTNHVLYGSQRLGTLVSGAGFGPSMELGAGSTSIESGPSGAMSGRYEYDAHGSPTTVAGSLPDVGWHGLLTSPATQLLAANARDYDPTTGTWLQPDPLGVDGGLNVYQYAHADPVNLSDPSGLCVNAIPNDVRDQAARRWFNDMLTGEGLLGKTGRLRPLRARSACEMDPSPTGPCAGDSGAFFASAEAQQAKFWAGVDQRIADLEAAAEYFGLSYGQVTGEMVALAKTLQQLEGLRRMSAVEEARGWAAARQESTIYRPLAGDVKYVGLVRHWHSTEAGQATWTAHMSSVDKADAGHGGTTTDGDPPLVGAGGTESTAESGPGTAIPESEPDPGPKTVQEYLQGETGRGPSDREIVALSGLDDIHQAPQATSSTPHGGLPREFADYVQRDGDEYGLVARDDVTVLNVYRGDESESYRLPPIVDTRNVLAQIRDLKRAALRRGVDLLQVTDAVGSIGVLLLVPGPEDLVYGMILAGGFWRLSKLGRLADGGDELALLGQPILVTQRGLQHVVERHTNSGIRRFARKSKFNPGENLTELLRGGTQHRMVRQRNGRFARTCDVGRRIGVDRATGGQTSIMTIITEWDGTLVTAFPGTP